MMPFFAGMLLAEGLGNRVPIWGQRRWQLSWLPRCIHLVWQKSSSKPLRSSHCAACFRSAGLVNLDDLAPLRWLGNMSYSYYLVHGFVVRVAMVILAQGCPSACRTGCFGVHASLVFRHLAGLIAFVPNRRSQFRCGRQ
jgi:hypothetical protein